MRHVPDSDRFLALPAAARLLQRWRSRRGLWPAAFGLTALALALILLIGGLIGCVSGPASASSRAAVIAAAAPRTARPAVLRIATTTSTADSGLLDALLPRFAELCGCQVEYIAVGSGQAIEIGRRGDADLLLVHSPAAEERFMADGFAKARFDAMFNDFVLVGPRADPAHIAGLSTAREAFQAIMAASAPFASRGDRSGTHAKELEIWATLGVTPTQAFPWYQALGQGMGDTLLFAAEQRAYALTDRGTYLAMREKLPDLVVLVGGDSLTENRDPTLINRYSILAINPERFPAVHAALAEQFVAWFRSAEARQLIAGFGVEKFGQPLFQPAQPAEMTP